MSILLESPEPVLTTPESNTGDIDESEALAIALMEEESQMAYRMQMEILSDIGGGELDGDALEAYNLSLQFMNEDYGVVVVNEEEEGEGGEIEDMSYDQLLDLGDQIGDVKTERWHTRNQQIIGSLPVHIFSPSTSLEEAITDEKCLVCLCEYEREEELKKLPCSHTFHSECIDGWLQDHDHCPLCKKPLDTQEQQQEEDNHDSKEEDEEN